MCSTCPIPPLKRSLKDLIPPPSLSDNISLLISFCWFSIFYFWYFVRCTFTAQLWLVSHSYCIHSLCKITDTIPTHFWLPFHCFSLRLKQHSKVPVKSPQEVKLAICAAKMQKLLTFNMFNWAGRDGPTSALCTLFLAYLAKVWAFTGPKIRDTYLISIICRFGANVLCHGMLHRNPQNLQKSFYNFPDDSLQSNSVYTYKQGQGIKRGVILNI